MFTWIAYQGIPRDIKYRQYNDFDELNGIGSGGHRIVYTAKYTYKGNDVTIPEIVVLKRFKSYDQTLELFISEVSIF